MTYQLLNEIASDNSKLHKIAVIAREANNGNRDFFRGLRLALDNIDTFGVKKVPVRSGADGAGLSMVTFETFAYELINRNLTGHAALRAIDQMMEMATNDEWNSWYRLILTKDLRAGFSESTVNKAVKDINAEYVIPTTPYMRCSLPAKSNMEDWDWSKGVYSQTKADGMFANVNVRADGYVWVTSRGGTLFPEGCLGLEDAMGATFKHGTQTHGELTVYQDGKLLARQLGNGILNSLSNGGSLEPGQIVVFDAWDQIPLEYVVPKGKYNVIYSVRFAALEAQVNAGNFLGRLRLTETRIVKSLEEAMQHYQEHRKRKLEGTVCKSGDAIWKDGTNKDQVKMKEEIDVELEVIGFNPGKGKNAATFGSMITRSREGLLIANISGISDDLRKDIDKNREDWMNAIITVCSNGIMYGTKKKPIHSLFLPRFTERRFDKTQADTFEMIEEQFAASIASDKEDGAEDES